ncbi:MAG: hypothetical protein ACP6IY_20270 [Promethearchaeia archaeon]
MLLKYKLFRDFILYKLRGIQYLEYRKALKKFKILELLDHPEERDIFTGFYIFGEEFLNFIYFVKKMRAYGIFDFRKIKPKKQYDLYYWIFRVRRES